MTAVLAHSSDHSSSQLFAPHRDTFAAFHPHRGSAGSHRNPFEAFAQHRHTGVKSRSTAASWRHSEAQTVARAPAPIDTPSPKWRLSGQSHSRTPSTSSETPSISWRSHVRSAAVRRVDMTEEPRASHPFVYSVGELLQLSASPLVGISKESQDIVDDLVARHVWRRGAQSGSPKIGRRRNNRGTSKPRSLQTSTDDSEHSD
ncbi:hypothetical protein BJV77DRAFT_478170 [Russula vinacea]|nr:hypothetical protein BJV77DRAFT_478170 [Russula vinacea]